MSEVQKLQRGVLEMAEALPAILTGIMQDTLRTIGMTAVTKYMIATRGPKSKAKGLPAVDSPVDSSRLTWRTGNLARSLTRSDHPDHVEKITASPGGSSVTGEIGTTVPYASIHEFGGVIPPTAIAISDRMRKFFWAKWYETGEEKWKHAALKRNPASVSIPARTLPARPFLFPAARDPETQESLRNLIGARVPAALAERMRFAIEGGR